MYQNIRSIAKPAIVSSLIVLSLLLASCCNECTQSSRPYLILYAFDAEGVYLSHEMSISDSASVLGRTIYIGSLEGKDIILAESGVGMTNAAMTTQSMIDNYNPAAVIFTGIAGAIDSNVNIGDIVVCGSWQTHDYGYFGKDGFTVKGIKTYHPLSDSIVRTEIFDVDNHLLAIAEDISHSDLSLGKIGDRTPKLSVGGIGVSGNCFVDSRDKRFWLQERFGAKVTDMESAAVAQVCAVNNLPFIAFRSASDLAGGSGSETAESELDKFFIIAADNSSKVVMKFLSKL